MIIFGLLFLTAINLNGQSFIGIYAGLNSGKFSGDSPPDFSYAPKISYSIGINYDIMLKKDVYLSIAPSYVNSKSTLKYPEEIDDAQVYEDSIYFDFHMISVPVMMKIISDNKRFNFIGGFEMLLPFKLMADNTVDEKDLITHVNKVNLNMLFGIGYRIPIKKSFLVLNLTYSHGLSNIANNLNDPDALLPRIRYTSFRFTAAWQLPVGKNNSEQN